MALSKNIEKKTVKVVAKKSAKPKNTSSDISPLRADRTSVLKQARITEKATILASQNVYVFDVATNATKRDVIMAIRDMYQITPTGVRMVRVVDKKVRSRRTGTLGVKRGGKKAYVTVKQGETLTV